MTEVENSSATEHQDSIQCGPVPGIKYPTIVQYCGECSMPIEYCEYSGKKDKCRQWLEQNLPELIADLDLTKDNKTDGDDEKKHQVNGAMRIYAPLRKGAEKVRRKVRKLKKANLRPKLQFNGPLEGRINPSRLSKGWWLSVGVIVRFYYCLFKGIDLKVASKYFASKFACGSSVTGTDEIVIQGDVKDGNF